MSRRAIIQDILRELTKLQKEDPFSPENRGRSYSAWTLPLGEGEGIFINEKIRHLITQYADACREADQYKCLKITGDRDEIDKKIFYSLGPILKNIELSQCVKDNTAKIYEEIEAVVRGLIAPVQRDYIYGCSFFVNQELSPIHIGPVCIEERQRFLERICAEGRISETTKERIKDILKQCKPADDFNATTYLPKQEDLIAQAIGNCFYVCSVQTEGFLPEIGKEKSSNAARLTLAAIAVAFNLKPSSSSFRLAYDCPPSTKSIYAFMKGKDYSFSYGDPNITFDLSGRKDDIISAFSENAEYFKTVGDIISFYLSSEDPSTLKRKKMLNFLLQSLSWYQEGIREKNNMIKIVKFAAALDALAAGEGNYRILSLIHARLGWDKDKALYDGRTTVKKIVENIYKEGRSRAIHGTSELFLIDHSKLAREAEHLARCCLRLSIVYASDNPSCNNPKALSAKNKNAA